MLKAMQKAKQKTMQMVFATGNPNKLREAAEILGKEFTLIMPKQLGYEGDIPETGNTVEANSREKAQLIWNMFHKTCFADDTALEVKALNGAPGVYSARYAGESKDSNANIAKLLDELAKVAASGKAKKCRDRSARFRTVVTLIHQGTVYSFEGILNGTIAESPSGEGGFGYDPVFIPEGCSCSLAEVTEEHKNNISHRGIAMRKLANFAGSLLQE
jgi:XTP/dITP diphosphohydrolase